MVRVLALKSRSSSTWRLGLVVAGLVACYSIKPLPEDATLAPPSPFDGASAGDAREILGVKLRWCPAGTFIMGSPPGEPERRPGEDQVEVMISKGFWMGQYEVTQGEWARVMGAFPAEFNVGQGDDFPMYRVTYFEVEDFSRRLTELAHASGELPADWEFRLPTEAQWEYAARAGTTTPTSFGTSLSSTQANFQGRPYNGGAPGPSINQTTPVGSYPPNPWGLYDLYGNVNEWCRDWVHEQLPGGVDPDSYSVRGETNRDGTYPRARRGGCYADDGWACRAGFRQRFEPERRHEHIGFRIVAVRT
ncbi:formylglycine-generating enzyme family protein [Archangium lansingense]|uniref:formylglycine-generating enzyme family protein n=1 Tax=Archangium lansingense TaxID=2995310 RepID=UPI003B78292A